MDDDELVLVVAGLMHDVGKVVQRSGEWVRHQNLSERLVREFLAPIVDVTSVRDLVVNHHESGRDGLLRFLTVADHVSAMERDVELEEDRQVEYKSVYRLLQSPLKEGAYYGLTPLGFASDLKVFKPIGESVCTKGDYENLLNNFCGDLERLRQIYNGSGSKYGYIVSLTEVVRKNLFFCPSAPSVEREPTNSLYEHSRMVAALSVCLKRSNGQGFTIIYGDVGGIQRFVYGQRVYKGALKSLRGRSLYVTMLSDAIAKHLLLALDLPHVNLIFSSGGNFMLVSELLNEERKRTLVNEVNRFLLNRHKGLLRVSLGFAEVRLKKDLNSGVSDAISEAVDNARAGKERVFYDLLRDNYSLFFEPKRGQAGLVCESCGLEIDDTGEAQQMQGSEEELPILCPNCFGLIKLAKDVASAEYLVEVWMDSDSRISQRSGDVLNFTADGLRVAYFFVKDLGEVSWLQGESGVKLVWVRKLNDTNFLPDSGRFIVLLNRFEVAFGFALIPTHTPLDEKGDIVSFDALASRSEGQRMVGFLKLDLDKLGELVRRHSSKLSSLATLSQLLSLIMEGCVNFVAKSFGNVYLIYSGGDDILAVGSWNDVIDFADRVSVELEGLTAGGVSFTAALSVHEPRAPVKVVMDYLGSVMRVAKERRDCIALGEEKLGWGNFRRVVGFAKKWAEDIKSKKISRSLVFNVARLFERYSEERYWKYVRHRLKYVLVRNIEGYRGSSVPADLDRLEKEYLQALSSLFPIMRVVTWLVVGLTREEVAGS